MTSKQLGALVDGYPSIIPCPYLRFVGKDEQEVRRNGARLF